MGGDFNVPLKRGRLNNTNGGKGFLSAVEGTQRRKRKFEQEERKLSKSPFDACAGNAGAKPK